MKITTKLILFLVILFSSHCFGICKDSIIYKKAYDYILESSVIKDAFDTKVIGICISDEILKQSTNAFSKQIVDYEFSTLDQNSKDSIESVIIREYTEEKGIVVRIDSNVSKIQTCDNCNFIAFFSDFKKGKLFITIEFYDPQNKDYKNLIKNLNPGCRFLFYFNENQEVEKVFSEVFYR